MPGSHIISSEEFIEQLHHDNLTYVQTACEIDESLIHTVNSEGWNLCHIAVEHGALNIAKWLVEAQLIDIKAKTNSGKTALVIAAENGYTRLVEFFLKKVELSVTLNEMEDFKRTSLMHAIKKGRLPNEQWDEAYALYFSNIAINTLKHDLKQIANKRFLEPKTQVEQYGDIIFKNLINKITSMGIGEFSSFTFGNLFENPAIRKAVKDALKKGAGDFKLLDKTTSHSDLYHFYIQIKEKISSEMVAYLSSIIEGMANKEGDLPLNESQAQALLDALEAAISGDMSLYEGIKHHFNFLNLDQMEEVEFRKSVLNKPTPNQALHVFFQRCYEVFNATNDKENKKEFLKFLTVAQEPNVLELMASSLSPKQLVAIGATFRGIDALNVLLDPSKFIEKTALKIAYNPNNLSQGLNKIGSIFSGRKVSEEKEIPFEEFIEQLHHDNLAFVQTACEIDKSLVHVVNSEGLNLCHIAVEHGALNVVKWLVEEQDFDIKEKTHSGQTVLLIAAENGYTRLVEFFLQKDELRVTINETDDFKRTPLMHAARKGSLLSVQLLVEAGAAINLKDNLGRTASNHASKFGHQAVVNFLVIVENTDLSEKEKNAKTGFVSTAHQDLAFLKALSMQAKSSINLTIPIEEEEKSVGPSFQ